MVIAVNKVSPAELAHLQNYTNLPSLAPPPGVIPIFTGPNQRGVIYEVLCAILLGIVYAFVFLRCYVKFSIKHTAGFEDVACILATIGLRINFGLVVALSQHGVGKHQWDVPVSELYFIYRFGRYNSILQNPTMLALKLSLLLLYHRTFAINKTTRYLIYFGMTFCFLAYTALMFFNIFVDSTALVSTNKVLGGVNLASDVYILCVPMEAISKLQLSFRKKIGVTLIFTTGIMACAMSIGSLVYRCQVQQTEADATYLLSGTLIVTTIEEEIGIMCACMPFFPAIVTNSPILEKCFHSVYSLGSRALGSTRHGSATDGTRNYQKHVSCDESIENGLELQRREVSTQAVLPESPRKTPRMESRAFEDHDRLRSSYLKL